MTPDEAVVLALGSSLSGRFRSPAAAIQAALRGLEDLKVRITKVSRAWRSAAWPDPDDPPFLNAAALVETSLSPHALLAVCKRLEIELGRGPAGRNAPRVIDLDLIAYGRTRIDDPDLVLPHPNAAVRGFVMGPLCEIAPQWRHPILHESACDLARRASVGADARPGPRRLWPLRKGAGDPM